MRLYHSIGLTLCLGAFLILAACTPAPVTQTLLQAQIRADGLQFQVQLPPGSTVQEALDVADLSLGSLDRVTPPVYTVLSEGASIVVVRVREEFEVEQVEIPFEQQLQPSELLPENEKQQLQRGENGAQEITYRRVYEDGVEVSKSAIKIVVLKDPVPQIMLVGVQAAFTPLPIPGRMVYLSDGNAWMLEGTTANRRALVATGDLDGRVFSLSKDGSWLLFTRLSEVEGVFNTLWAVSVDDPAIEIDLHTQNIVHFADWLPGSTEFFAYSTVEPRAAAPGWQANNDLHRNYFSANGWVSPDEEQLIDTNYGGAYGWWGTEFAYAPDGAQLAFANPNQVGLITEDEGITQTLLLEVLPYETRSSWAWVPSVRWSPDGKTLFTVDHVAPAGAVAPEESANFVLTAVPLTGGDPLHLIANVGMFAYPIPSPLQTFAAGEQGYQVAYLQALSPEKREESSYQLMIMDRDGSNRQRLFPPEGKTGLNPHKDWGVWSPAPWQGGQGYLLAFLYEGNIWLADTRSAETWQITGDGRINRLDWK